MSEIDHLDLDGHLLQVFLAVHEEGSVTRAARRLDVTQSAISHGLERLRAIVGDALFVKSGRGIAPTSMAEELAPRARALLDDLRAFSVAAGVDLARLATCVTIAANDLQRDLLLPRFLRRVRCAAPNVTLRVIPSGVPEAAMMRDDACQLVISPRPPEGGDIFQKRLFEDRYRVFYDPARRAAPVGRDDYLAADHVTVVYHPRRALDIDEWLRAQGVQRRIVATVPAMGGLAAMLRGSECLATAPSLLGPESLRGLAAAPVPFDTPGLPMYMVWHRRHHADPVQRWLRDEIEAVAAGLPAA